MSKIYPRNTELARNNSCAFFKALFETHQPCVMQCDCFPVPHINLQMS